MRINVHLWKAQIVFFFKRRCILIDGIGGFFFIDGIVVLVDRGKNMIIRHK